MGIEVYIKQRDSIVRWQIFQQIGMVQISLSKEDNLPLFHNGLSAGVAKGWCGKKQLIKAFKLLIEVRSKGMRP